MALDIDTRFGVYTIIGKLGQGGMGEVYRARDTRLDRDVAIKILPEMFASDAERTARFRREAKTLASLNHPNIGSIHGLEEASGLTGLVLELIEGPTLAERIAQGPIPIDEALSIARQMAEALEAAHEQGIIHRDLKPANIKIRDDGTVKVLDFGLAKALGSDGASSTADVSMSPTLSLPAGTRVGTLLGTAAYMSPEQAKGRSVDRRADVWAFGAVVYEMLTGTRAFAGDDVSDTLVSVLRDDPDWTALPADIPASVRQTLRVCLQKDPKKRVRDMSAVRLALEGAFDAPSAAATAIPVPRARWPIVLPWAIGTFIVGGLAAAGIVRSSSRPLPAPVERFVITTPADAPPAILGLAAGAIAMSRDGSHLVYRSSPPAEATTPTPTNLRLYLRVRGQLEPTLIRGTEGANSPFFSPDGQWIAFGSGIDNTLKRISVQGGPAQTICPIEGLLLGGTWGTDDTIVFAANSGLRRVPAGGGVPQVLTTVDPAAGESAHVWPDFLPDGKSVVFTSWNGSAERSRISVVSVADGRVSVLVPGGTQPHVTPTGHLLFAVGGAVRAVRFDPGRRSIVGSPVPVVEGVAMTSAGGAHYAVAADGALVYVSGTSGASVPPRTMFWVDRQGRQEAIKVPARAYAYARLSPDGTRVALDARDQQNDIWIWDLKRETLLNLTRDPGLNRLPIWTPDSQRVAFSAEREGTVEKMYWQAADGSGVPERLTVSETYQVPSSFSHDGRRLVFATPLTPPRNVGVLSLDDHKEAMLLDTSFDESNGVISPDGRWLAYQSNESGSAEIYLAPFPDVHASGKQPVSTGGGTRPLWRQDGRELFYYVEPGTIMAVPITPGADLTLGRPAVVVEGPYASPIVNGRHYDVSPDGKRFLLLKDVEPSGSTKLPPPEIRVVLHWVNELERLVPAK